MTSPATVAYRPAFDCLWCGDPWTARGPDDLEGWAQLCPACLGKAGSNPFLRARLRGALAARATAGRPAAGPGPGRLADASVPTAAPRHRMPAAAPQPAFPDDWYLRRGAFERGAVHDAAWAAELDMVTRWLDALPLATPIVELAAGTGFFAPLLAERGELFAYEADGAALGRARERLVAHRLRAHLHVADPWAPFPAGADPTPSGALVVAFLLGRVRGAGLDAAAASLRTRLAPGGRLAVIDLRPDPAGGPPSGTAWSWHDPSLLEATLLRGGFADVVITTTGRFFLTVQAVAR